MTAYKPRLRWCESLSGGGWIGVTYKDYLAAKKLNDQYMIKKHGKIPKPVQKPKGII